MARSSDGPIWFFIGISLAVNGALILATGIYQIVNPPANPSVVLFQPACECMVGRGVAGVRSHLSIQVRARATSPEITA
jgi:hypothetical protein